MGQNERLYSVNEIRRGTGVVLNCQAINYHPSLPIIWVINGIAYSNGLPPDGLRLRSSDLRTALFHMHDVQTPAEYASGDYRCEVWGYIPNTRAVSPSLFLKLNGRSVKLHWYEERFHPSRPKTGGLLSFSASVRLSVHPSVSLSHCPSIRMIKLLRYNSEIFCK